MESSDAQIRLDLRTFVLNTFLFGAPSEQLDDAASLLEEGIVDSTGVIELVSYIESRFGIAVADHELVPENLDSIDRLCAFVRRKDSARAL
jgi:acyl carrier protein